MDMVKMTTSECSFCSRTSRRRGPKKQGCNSISRSSSTRYIMVGLQCTAQKGVCQRPLAFLPFLTVIFLHGDPCQTYAIFLHHENMTSASLWQPDTFGNLENNTSGDLLGACSNFHTT